MSPLFWDDLFVLRVARKKSTPIVVHSSWSKTESTTGITYPLYTAIRSILVMARIARSSRRSSIVRPNLVKYNFYVEPRRNETTNRLPIDARAKQSISRRRCLLSMREAQSSAVKVLPVVKTRRRQSNFLLILD